MVRMFNPKTLQLAYSLAKLEDALKNDPVTTRTISGKGTIDYPNIKIDQYCLDNDHLVIFTDYVHKCS